MPALQGRVGDHPRKARTHTLRMAALCTITAIFGWSPGLRAQSPNPSSNRASKPAGAVKDEKADAEPRPLDLSYSPAKTRCIVAVRPAAILRRPDMKGTSEAFLERAIRECLGSDERLETRFDPEGIEQIAIGFLDDPLGDDPKARPSSEAPLFLVIRATEDVDWRARITAFVERDVKEDLEWVRIPSEGGDYYRLQLPNPSIPCWPVRAGACFFPDRRTVVVTDNEEALRERMPHFGQDEPDLVRTDGWREVSGGLIAFASEPEDPDVEADDAGIVTLELLSMLPPGQKPACRCFGGVAEDEVWRFRASLRCRDEREADRTTATLRGLLIQIRIMAGLKLLAMEFGMDEELRKDFPPIVRRCLGELVRSGAIGRQGSAVEITSRFKLRLAELPKVLEAAGLSTPDDGSDRTVRSFNATPGKSSR